MATFNTELARRGPGLLLRDVLRGDAPDVLAVQQTILDARPDIIVLQGIDYDLEHQALTALRDALQEAGLSYPHLFAAPPNAGRRTPLDLDGDGRTGGPGDAQGYGRFFGQGSMAVLSRFPINADAVQDFTPMLWRNLPGALLPQTTAGAPFPSADAQDIQRLHSHGAWVLPVLHPTNGTLHVMTYHASPPVFDGPEDRNGRRNHDETAFWQLYLDGGLGAVPQGPFVLMGDANLDPVRGDGRHKAMVDLLAHPRLQDPAAGTDTVSWPATGPMRVDYVLPSADLRVVGAGMAQQRADGSRHRLVWVDIKLP